MTRQLRDGLTLTDFGDRWELAHLVPPALFDQTNEDDLRLCWSHVNVIGLPVDIARSRMVWVDFALAELTIRRARESDAVIADALKSRLLCSAERLRKYHSPVNGVSDPEPVVATATQ